MLDVRLLGDFRLRLEDGTPVVLRGERLQSLAGYLLLHRGTPTPRRKIAYAFWPDASERQGLRNLRNLLHRLRGAIPESDAYVVATPQAIRWKSSAPFVLDVSDVERFAREGREAVQRADYAAARSALAAASDRYGGDLLGGLMDDWIYPERDRLHHEIVGVLELLVQLLEADRLYPEALRHAHRLLEIDPLREPTYRLLMRLYAESGDRAGARRIFDQCRAVLERELDMEPEPETVAAWNRISQTGEMGTSTARSDEFEVPLVGRREEWKALRSAWDAARGGRALFAALVGEAGIGKTRLADELAAWCERQGYRTAVARCYAAEGRLAYAPVAEWLRDSVVADRLQSLDEVWLRELSRLLPELDTGEVPELAPLREGWQRQRMFDAMARAILAAGPPLVLVMDDAQWCDRDSLEWLRYFLRIAKETPLLVVGTVREEEVGPDHQLHGFRPELVRTQQYVDIMVPRLDARETMELARHVAGDGWTDRLAERLFDDTEGNPLFVIESLRAGMVGEKASASPVAAATGLDVAGPLRVPRRVHSVLTRRLGQLSPRGRSTVSLAAAIGRSFSFDLLSRASHMDSDDLVDVVEELLQSGVLRERESGAFDFTHDKLREAAYAELTAVRRRLLHRRIAEALEADEDGGARASALAAHYDLAGTFERAVAWYERAARDAERVGSYGEVSGLLSRARDLLHEMREGEARDETLLRVLVALGLALRVSEGHAADAVGRVFDEAWHLSGIAATSRRFVVRRCLWSFHLLRGEYETALRDAEELLSMASANREDGLRLEALVAMGLTLLWRGELAESRECLEVSLELYDPARHGDHALRYGQDPGVAAASLLAYAECLLGNAGRSGQMIREALERARTMEHAFSYAYALQHAMLIAHAGRRPDEALRYANALLELSEDRGFTFWIGPATIGRGWAQAVKGRADYGADLIRQGMEGHRDRGARLSWTVWTSMLAEAEAGRGRIDEAIDLVDEALRTSDTREERIWEAELMRMRGELLMRNGADGAADCLRRASDAAGVQGSTLFLRRIDEALSRAQKRP